MLRTQQATLFEEELKWLEKVIRTRKSFGSTFDMRNFTIEAFKAVYDSKNEYIKLDIPEKEKKKFDVTMPALDLNNHYHRLVEHYSWAERLLLILSIANDLRPFYFNSIISDAKSYYGYSSYNFEEKAGLVERNDFGIVPTAQFFIYLIAGEELAIRLELIKAIAEESLLPIKNKLVEISEGSFHQPIYSGMFWMNKQNFINIIC
ncbi:MAG TPA: hypothetical protein VK766_05495 [Cytophagaceae bacterium]|jgi:hypothetical protein|nr:hypothetical protein [Cytophagaceae bacterium]